MSVEIRSAIDLYERHPISSEIILAKLNASRGHLNDVAPEELFPHDQDHYGGLEANDALADNLQAYADLIRRAGFTVNSVEDLTGDWGVILKQRLAMYRKLREETQAAGTPAGHDAFYKSYVRFVDLVNDAALGGGRFVGEKPG